MGILILHSVNMRVQASLLLVVCLTTAARAHISCEECMHFTEKFLDNFSSDEITKRQSDMLSTILCPMAEDPTACSAIFAKHWAGIAGTLYPRVFDPKTVCVDFGMCDPTRKVGWKPECNSCMSFTYQLGDIIVQRTKIADIKEIIKGEYCTGTTDPEDCAAKVEMGAPHVLTMLSEVIQILSPTYCCNIEGFCCDMH